jgi:hypothetical protein
MQNREDRPGWLEEFEDLANNVLEEGSACNQIHPMMAAWYEAVMAGDPPESRDSIWQALQCLTTEALHDIPQAVAEVVVGEDAHEELANWVTELLLIGRAFQIALDKGQLDDL